MSVLIPSVTQFIYVCRVCISINVLHVYVSSLLIL